MTDANLGMAHIIERVCAKDLALTTLARQNFEESVERLYLSLLKTNAAILDLGDGGWDDKLQTCLASVSPDALANGMTKRSVRGRPAIARLVNEYRLGQKGQHDWCEQEDLQQVWPLLSNPSAMTLSPFMLNRVRLCMTADSFLYSTICKAMS